VSRNERITTANAKTCHCYTFQPDGIITTT
jgi:hypothetical protein